jgi:hypothetical protein
VHSRYGKRLVRHSYFRCRAATILLLLMAVFLLSCCRCCSREIAYRYRLQKLKVMHCCKSHRAAVFVAVALLALGQHSSSFMRLASGQGLSVSADNLGAGAEATANEFEQFESALELATTGGRGR